MILKIYTDGGSKGNPGPSSIGGVFYLDKKKVFDFKKSIGIATNNDAIANFDLGNNQQAISQLQQASQSAVTNDTKINTLKNLAYVYSTEGKEDLALQAFKEALALTSTGSFEYYLISGEVAELEDKYNSAILSYNKA